MELATESGPQPGQVLGGKYVLREILGAGGMGVVFAADQPALARAVAIKMLRSDLAADPRHKRRFLDEALAASRVAHPNSTSVIDFGTASDGALFIVMELVCGPSIRELVSGQPPLELPCVLSLVEQILGAVGAAHAEGVIHADIKSDNVLVETRRDGTLKVKLSDYGLARMEEAASGIAVSATAGAISGTPEYMAPEIVNGGPPTRATDLYGVGIILYELLTGDTPFSGGTEQEVMVRQVCDVVVPPSLRCPDRNFSSALDRVVARALAKDPAERFANAAMFALALRNAMRAPVTVTIPYRCSSCGARGALQDPRFCGSCGARSGPTPPHQSASVDTPTRVDCPPRIDRPFARGSNCDEAPPDRLAGLRRMIGSAIRRGDVPAIAREYLALASALFKARQPAAARKELEEGILVLTAGASTLNPSAPLARLLVALADLP